MCSDVVKWAHVSFFLRHVKTIVIPDLHHRLAWVAPTVAAERPDRVIFLGDGPDARGKAGKGYSAAARLIVFMKAWLARDDVVWLIGNHEAQYIFNHEDIRSNAWKHWRWKRYRDDFGMSWWRKMKLAHSEQGWLLSHAGFREELAHPILGFDPVWLERYEREMFEASCLAPTSWTMIGDGRLQQPKGNRGGVTWLDWNTEFKPIPGVNQIVGHTEDVEPRWNNTAESLNLCLDTGCRHYALIEDGNVTVKPVLV
jgi:hypothetical protein